MRRKKTISLFKLCIKLVWILEILHYENTESLTVTYGFENQPFGHCHNFPFNTSDRHIILKNANGTKIWNRIIRRDTSESTEAHFVNATFVNNSLLLCVRNLSRTDIGNYSLEEVKSARKIYFNIDVYYGPTELLIEPKLGPLVTLDEYSSLTVICSARCNPDCYITWLKETQELSFSASSKLVLKNVTKHNGGNYTCVAKHPKGQSHAISKSHNIFVKYPPQIDIIPNQNLQVKEYGDLNVFCDVESFPSSNISWIRDGKRLNTIESSENEVSLYLLNNTCNDTGMYECLAFNDVGRNVSKFIKIDVICKPRFIGDDVGYIITETRIASVGDEVIIHVKIQANPLPYVKSISPETDVYFQNLSETTFALYIRKQISSDFDFRWHSVIIGNSEGNVTICLKIEEKSIGVLNLQVIVEISLSLFLFLCISIATFILVKRKKQRKEYQSQNNTVSYAKAAELQGENADMTEYSLEDAHPYQNRVREIELAAIEAYENLSITENSTSYEDICSKTDVFEGNTHQTNRDIIKSEESEINCNIRQDSDGYLIVTGSETSDLQPAVRKSGEYEDCFYMIDYKNDAKADTLNNAIGTGAANYLNIEQKDQNKFVRRTNNFAGEIIPNIGKRPNTF